MKKFFALLLSAILLLTACSAEKPADFERGTVLGKTYRNDSVGLTVTLPEDWSFLSDEERENLYGGFDAFDETGVFVTCYDAGAWKESGASLMITYENAAVLYGEDFSAENYLSTAETSLVAQLSEQYGDVFVERLETEISGKTVPYLSARISVGEMELYDCLLAREVPNGIVSVSFCVFSEGEREAVFSAIDFS